MSDVFCAICCGPMWDIIIATEPRSEGFRAAQQVEDLFELYWDEVNSYDCEIITKEETAWAETILLLGFNPKARGFKNIAFLAPSGTYQGYNTVSVEDSPDGNFIVHDVGNSAELFECYEVIEDDCPHKEPAFPFHTSCYSILRRRLSDRSNGNLSIDVLYSVMRSLTMRTYLDINYGELYSDDVCVDHWHSNDGQEVFVANPGLIKGLEGRIQEMMRTGYFHLPESVELDLGHGVQKDPFRGLPFDILLTIAEQLDDPRCFMNWTKASWSVHTLVRSAQDSFWKKAICRQMPWFFELYKCLDDDELCRSLNMRAVFLWAACRSELRFGMKGGDFLRLANRRRIWTSSCKDLTDQYYRMLSNHASEGGGGHDMILSKALCRRMYDVTRNEQAQLYTQTQECYWVDKWEDTYTKTQLFEAFFMHDNGFLTGIAVTTDGGTCRLIGSIDEESLRFKAVIPAEDWICGIVLHIPVIEFIGTLQGDIGETSPKGITIICKSGHEIQLGENDRGYSKRAIIARPGRQVVGLAAKMAADIPLTTFNSLGLLTLLNEDLPDQRILTDSIIQRRHPLIDEVMWKDDGTCFFGTPYWNNPDIRIVFGDGHNLGTVDDYVAELTPHLLPHEAFIWAKDATELRQLKRMSIFTTYSETQKTDQNGNTVPVKVYNICGLGAEFVTEHNEGQRAIGLEGKVEEDKVDDNLPHSGPYVPSTSLDTKVSEKKGHGDFRLDLDIDGPGGEIITEVFICRPQYEAVIGIKVCTNRGREAGCYPGPYRMDWSWASIRAQPNSTLVGLIATFANGGGESKDKGLRTYKELSSLAAISMRLDIDEETGESSVEEYDYIEGYSDGEEEDSSDEICEE